MCNCFSSLNNKSKCSFFLPVKPPPPDRLSELVLVRYILPSRLLVLSSWFYQLFRRAGRGCHYKGSSPTRGVNYGARNWGWTGPWQGCDAL